MTEPFLVASLLAPEMKSKKSPANRDPNPGTEAQ